MNPRDTPRESVPAALIEGVETGPKDHARILEQAQSFSVRVHVGPLPTKSEYINPE
jgi:adenylosuccinate synthase